MNRPLLVVAILAVLPADAFERRSIHMATVVQVVLPTSGGDDEARLVFDAFEAAERDLNEWRSGSPLARLNDAAGGRPVPVPDSLFTTLERGRDLSALTNGAFDVTWAALWDLWDFDHPEARPPKDPEIRARQSLVGYRDLILDARARTARLARPGMKVGLGGIAKGVALEQAARALRGAGVTDFAIVAGGQVYAGGRRDGRPWRVGIRDPRRGPTDYFTAVDVVDASVSTSGDYERYFVHRGRRYHHVLDPRTGRPSRGLRSATVITADPVVADALSTALMVLGRAEALALVDRLDGVDAILVDDALRVHFSGGVHRFHNLRTVLDSDRPIAP